MTLFEEIRAALKRHALTQAEFAARAGIRETYMSRILSEEPDLRMSTAGRIRETLDTLEHEARA